MNVIEVGNLLIAIEKSLGKKLAFSPPNPAPPFLSGVWFNEDITVFYIRDKNEESLESETVEFILNIGVKTIIDVHITDNTYWVVGVEKGPFPQRKFYLDGFRTSAKQRCVSLVDRIRKEAEKIQQ